MAENLITILDRLNERITVLTSQNSELRHANAQLREENADLQRRTEEAETARTRAELDVDYLKVSHKLADNPDNLIATRRRIAGLIRNIDRCLEMLKE